MTMQRRAIRTLGVAVPLVVVLLLALPSAVFATRGVIGAAVDGQASVTVQPGATLRVDVRVVTSGGGEADDWKATAWTIGSSTGCANHDDAESAGTHVRNLDVTVPASAGTYDATFVAYQNDDCSGTQGSDVSLTLTNAVIVDDTILFDDHFRGTTEANNLELTTPPWTEDADGNGQLVMRRIDTTAPGTPQDGFSDGHLGLTWSPFVTKEISTAGKSNIQLRYTWGKDTSAPPFTFGILYAEWIPIGGSTWLQANTHILSSGPAADPETPASFSFPPSANNTTIYIRFRPVTFSQIEWATVDNVVVTGSAAPSGPTKLAFTTSPFTGAYGACLGPITVQTQNASSTPTNVTANTTVTLSSDATGAFFSDGACTSSVPSVLIALGGNSASFYYRAGAVGDGTHELTASATGLTSASQTQTISKANPTCNITGYTGVYDGDPHGASGSCTGVSGETLSGLVLGASYTYVPGGTASWSFTDVTGNYNNDSGSVAITISKATLTVTADNKTAQYSDAGPALTFQYGAFMGSEGASVIDSSPSCSTTRLISSPAGDYPITCSGGADNNYTFSFYPGTFTVTKEDAGISLDNEVAVQVDSPGEDINTLILYADVQETTPDAGTGPAAGEIDNAQVSMALTPVGPGSPETGTCVKDHDNGSTGYAKVTTWKCTFTTVEVNVYLVEASVVGNYYTGGPAEDVLVVYDPSLGFTTGGGWFYWPDTEDKTNFGYTMKYNKKGNKIQGSLLLIRHADEGNYRVKSNMLGGLALGEGTGFGWASFNGKCTYQEPDWPEPEGNHEFLVYVEDWGEPGAGSDKFWIEVSDDDGNLSMMTPAQDNLKTLDGGNIVVPHTPN